jgi:hypothetical protein
MHDVPCYVVFDMENYCQGYSNKAVLSFGFAAVGSELYEVPERFRYRQFINRDPDADPVSCVIEGITALQELYADLKKASQAHPKHRLTDAEKQAFQARQAVLHVRRPAASSSWSTATSRASTGARHATSATAKISHLQLPCLAHNYGGYDSGAIMRAIARMPGTATPRVIHRSREKQICCTWEGLVFRDSLNILSGSLAKLIADARKEGDLKRTFPLT